MTKQFKINYTVHGVQLSKEVSNTPEKVFKALHELRESGVQDITIGIAPYLSQEHFDLLNALIQSIWDVSNAIDADETDTLNDALAELDMFTMSLDELYRKVAGQLADMEYLVLPDDTNSAAEPQNARLTYFGIDGVYDSQFEGYTLGETWNGWDMPYFTKKQALEVAAAFVEQTEYDNVYHDPNSDTFVFYTKGLENEEFGSTVIYIDGELTTVYPIGGGGWVWKEEEKEDVTPDEIHAFKKHMENAKNEMLDKLDNEGYLNDFDIRISIKGKSISLPLHADLYEKVDELLRTEYHERKQINDTFYMNVNPDSEEYRAVYRARDGQLTDEIANHCPWFPITTDHKEITSIEYDTIVSFHVSGWDSNSDNYVNSVLDRIQ